MHFSLDGVGRTAFLGGRNALWRLGAMPKSGAMPSSSSAMPKYVWAQCPMVSGRNAQSGALPPNRAQCLLRRAQCPMVSGRNALLVGRNAQWRLGAMPSSSGSLAHRLWSGVFEWSLKSCSRSSPLGRKSRTSDV
eukprot:8862456-Pyramimonas_sp.AAC.1